MSSTILVYMMAVQLADAVVSFGWKHGMKVKFLGFFELDNKTFG